jgi:hypothetical protein
MSKEIRERVEDLPWPTRTASASNWPELAHRELVSRIVTSPTFARSERLSTLLTYVCDMALKGRVTQLSEQKIGHAVFGRSPDYDSSIDGIVRTQASRLRQRLDLYFEQEGAEEPVRIVIPKGGYVPVFLLRQSDDEPRNPVSQPRVAAEGTIPLPSLAVAPATTSSRGSMLPWILCVLLIGAIAALQVRNHRNTVPRGASMPSHPLWSQIFLPQHPTLEVPGDSGLVLSHVFDGRKIPLSEYLMGDYRSASANFPERPLSPEMRSLRAEVAGRRYTSIVDLEASATLMQIAGAAHSSLQVRYARDLRPNDLKNGNVILIGAFEANPWVELFERNMNFVLQNDYKTRVFSVVNRSPHPGEPAHWDSIWDDPQHRVYGVVAFTPNLSGNGNALLIEGTSMAGTEAAWDFISDDSELLPFLKKIQHSDGKIPHFELLVATQNMSSSAVHSSLLAWRTTD